MIPIGNFVLVKPEVKKQILVSDQGSLCEYGEVLAIGPEVTRVKVGEKIGFLVFGVNALEVEDTKHYFVPDNGEFIMAKL